MTTNVRTQLGSNSFDVFEYYLSIMERERLKDVGGKFYSHYRDIEYWALRIERLSQDIRQNASSLTSLNEKDSQLQEIVEISESLMELWIKLSNKHMSSIILLEILKKKLESLGNFLEGYRKIIYTQHEGKLESLFPLDLRPNLEDLKDIKEELKIPKKERGGEIYYSLSEGRIKDDIDGKLHDCLLELFMTGTYSRRKSDSISMPSKWLKFFSKGVEKFFPNFYKKETTDSKASRIENQYENIVYEWSLIYSTNSNNLKDVTNILWPLANGLSSIENVEVILVDWGKGSFWSKITIRIKGWLAKEEVKSVLEKSRKSAEAYYLDRNIEGVEKTKLERTKLEEEIKRLQDVRKLNELRDLEIEEKKIEIAKKINEIKGIDIDNKLKELDYIKGISELIKNGFLAVDSDFQIEINDLSYLKKDMKGNLILGKSINDIDSGNDTINSPN